eukprot:gene14296-biopygen13022
MFRDGSDSDGPPSDTPTYVEFDLVPVRDRRKLGRRDVQRVRRREGGGEVDARLRRVQVRPLRGLRKVLSNQPRGPIPARIYIFRGLDVPTRPLRRRLARVPPVERRPRLVLLDAPPPLRVARRAIKPPAHRVREPRADAAAVGGAR